MGTIGRRIDTTIKHLIEKDYENALIQLCIAIDATAKKKWQKFKPGQRIRLFITEYEAFIYQFATSGALKLVGSGHQRGKISFGAELPEILYKSIRCALHHGDEISDYISIEEKRNILGVNKGKLVFNIGFIDGFLFSVIVDLVNQYENCDSDPFFIHNGVEIRINEVWGNLQKLEQLTGYKKLL